jgi:tetratricopeptide (TPR) repeat protein
MQNVETEAAEPFVDQTMASSDEAPGTQVMDEKESTSWFETGQESEAFEAPRVDTGSLPSWLRGVDAESASDTASQDDLPAWLREESADVTGEPFKIEPTRSSDWQPVNAVQPEAESFVQPEEEPAPAMDWQPVDTVQPETESFVQPEEEPVPVMDWQSLDAVPTGSDSFVEPEAEPAPKPKKPAPKKSASRPVTPVGTYSEPVTRKGTGILTQTVDMVLGEARNELSRSNIPGALETYGKLIKRGRYLDEAIHDLREALYRYPVEVSLWQSLGDAYMRANRLQDALDAYTKAEELLR